MKVKDLKQLLATINDDLDISVSVGDYYSSYGYSASLFNYDANSSIHNTHVVNDMTKTLTLYCNLNSIKPYFEGEVEKHPKITFRK